MKKPVAETPWLTKGDNYYYSGVAAECVFAIICKDWVQDNFAIRDHSTVKLSVYTECVEPGMVELDLERHGDYCVRLNDPSGGSLYIMLSAQDLLVPLFQEGQNHLTLWLKLESR